MKENIQLKEKIAMLRLFVEDEVNRDDFLDRVSLICALMEVVREYVVLLHEENGL